MKNSLALLALATMLAGCAERIGAGTSKGDLVQVYRDTATGQLFFREPEDFIGRMEVIK